MAKKINVNKTYKELMKLAEEYGVSGNAMFLSAANQYEIQMRVIEEVRVALDESDELMSKKEYVKGRENIYAHPLVKELPKLTDSANRTLGIMLNIITTLGSKKEVSEELNLD